MSGFIKNYLSANSLGRKLLYLVTAFITLFAANFLTYNYLLRVLGNTTAAIDAAGRQRMLSQKIAYTALKGSTGGSSAALRKLASDFEQTLYSLRHGGYSRTFLVGPAPAEILPLLDREELIWQDYREAALSLAASRHGTAAAKAAIARIEADSEPLLAACDAVTEAFRLNARKTTRLLNLVMILLDAVMLLLGIAAVLFAFRKVTNPIVAMSSAARDLADGNFTLTGAEEAGGEIGALSATFTGMAHRIGRDLDKQAALNRLLSVSAGHGSLPELLGSLLDGLLEIPWLKLRSKGAVFLAAAGTRKFRLAAQRGLPAEIAAACAEVEPGRCLCGHAALAGEAVSAQDLDKLREADHSGPQAQGHYCLPIKIGDRTAGVLTLYLEPGHTYAEEEQLFLNAAAVIMGKAVEYKALEAKAYQAQKMESLGRAAGAVAHDFNNILTVIKGFNELIQETAAPDSEISRYAKEAGGGIEKGAALVKQVLDFSRSQQQQAKLDLNEAVTGSKEMLAMVVGSQVRLQLDLADRLPAIEANKDQLNQVLMNLAVNARDAMQPGGGTLTISTAAEGGAVRLSVKDTGSGMSPEVIEQVFEPFFTTKPEGTGTGLGLATVYSIVKAHKGEISIESAPGQGATFTITLPAAG